MKPRGVWIEVPVGKPHNHLGNDGGMVVTVPIPASLPSTSMVVPYKNYTFTTSSRRDRQFWEIDKT